MPRLHIFNPEHEYALANGGAYYIAPRSVRELAAKFQLLPVLWASNEDYILLDNDRIYSVENEKDYASGNINGIIDSIEPWGWNEALKERLRKIGIEECLLPSYSEITRLRNLSHRRITVEANRFLDSPFLPVELTDKNEALHFYEMNKGCYFKMPWSSSGRGVLATEELNIRQVEEWVTGSIRKQGSVMAEKKIERALDLATLWNVNENRTPEFLGLSVTKSDGRGKYVGNMFGSQRAIENYIKRYTDYLNEIVIEKQKGFISKHIAPFYRGLLGIDMIIDENGILFPCIEVNLRRTMGHVALTYDKKMRIPANINPLLPLIDINSIL